MKNVVIVIGMMCVLLGGLSAQATWTMQYDATILPDTSGAIVYDDGTTSSFSKPYAPTTAEILSPDIFHLSTLGSDNGGYYIKYIGDTDRFQANGEVGYVVEMRAKLRSTDESGFTSAALLDCEDGRRDVQASWNLALSTESDGKNYARLSGEYGTPKTNSVEIGTDFHIFKVAVQAGGDTGYTATLYIDNQLIGSVQTEDNNEIHQLRFGDLTGSADGDWDVDYIYGQDVPEPATIGLLLLGLGMWRKSRR